MSNVSPKVRAVYEALETRKHKQALKLLVPLLEKKPTNAQLRVLKALALVRSGRNDEALQLARLLKSDPTVVQDETLLNNLAIVFREGGAASEATACFESALANDPNNEELAHCVFGAYVRGRDYLKQQQLAQKMFKAHGCDEYFLWSLAATVLQVQFGAPAKLLVLTQRQLSKRAEEGKMKTYEEVQLYIDVLSRQLKYQDAVGVVDSALGDLFSSKVERLQTKARLLVLQEGGVAEACAVYNQLVETDEGLVKGAEEWSHVKGVLDCILLEHSLPPPHPADSPPSPAHMCEARVSKEDWDRVVALGQALVERLRSKAAEGGETRVTRTPYLAAVEHYSRLAALQDTHAPAGGVEAAPLAVAAILSYIEAMGDRDVCAYDLVEPLRRLLPAQLPLLLAQLERTPGAAPYPSAGTDDGAIKDGGKVCVARCHAFATVVKVRQLLGAYAVRAAPDSLQQDTATPSPLQDTATTCNRLTATRKEELEVEADTLLHAFTLACRHVERSKGYPADRSASDDCALAAARILMDLYVAGAEERVLVDAIVAARYGLALSPTNFQFKLVLLRLYRMAGAFDALYDLFLQLEVKHILLDTLSYLIVPQSCEWAAVGKVKSLADAILRLDRDNARDSPEYTHQAYKTSTFSKIPELIAFEHKLRCSAQMAAAKMHLQTQVCCSGVAARVAVRVAVCVAVCCSVLQCAAVIERPQTQVCCSVGAACVAVCCSNLTP